MSRKFGDPPLSARLMNHWLVALFGLFGTCAIATVPRLFEMPGSFWMGGKVATWVARRAEVLLGSTVPKKPPPWIMKPGMERWTKLEAIACVVGSMMKNRFWSRYFRKLVTVIGFCWPKRAISMLPSTVVIRTALLTSGSEKAVDRSIERAGAPEYSVKSATW